MPLTVGCFNNVKNVSEDNIGTFLSQVSTESGVHSHAYYLHVVVPKAYILGTDEYYAQAGNAISLVCIIEDVSKMDKLFSYH